MGYPMTYQRVVNRNGLLGDYSQGTGRKVSTDMVAGDLRRLEKDTMDDWHVAAYAELVGIDPADVQHLFMLFFDSYEPGNRAVVLQWEAEHGRKHPSSGDYDSPATPGGAVGSQGAT